MAETDGENWAKDELKLAASYIKNSNYFSLFLIISIYQTSFLKSEQKE